MAQTIYLAGAARRVINPPKGVYQIGYAARSKGNQGVHDDLTATALVLDSGGSRAVVVALDILTINEFVVDRVRARLAPLEVILCCSHTHSGPIAYADGKSPRKEREYIDWLVEQIVLVVQQAQANLIPARVEFAHAEAGVGINRRERLPSGEMVIGRNPEGVRDASVQVLSILDAQNDSRLATMVNYACHGTVLGPDNLLISADWIGYMRGKVEAELDGLVLFLQGAAANINPDMFWEDAHAYEMAEKQGLGVAEAVLAAVSQSLECLEHTVQIGRAVVWLPTEAPVTTTRPPKNYGKPLIAMANLPGFLTIFADIILDKMYPWKSVIEARDGFWSVPMRINALRIGETALVTNAAETFTEIGLKVKQASPATHTLFASVSDGCISYLSTAAAYPEGGYEVEVAPQAYRYPAKLQPICEKIALDATHSLLAKLWG